MSQDESTEYNQPIQTLRIDPRDRTRLAHAMNTASQRRLVSVERRDHRVEYLADGCEMRFVDNTDLEHRYAITPRNLSTNGLAFIHGCRIDTHANCAIKLITIDGEPFSIDGVIRRCRHVRGVIHEIAVEFETCIDLSKFVHLEEVGRGLVQTAASTQKYLIVMAGPETPSMSQLLDHISKQACDVERIDHDSLSKTLADKHPALLLSESRNPSEHQSLVTYYQQQAPPCPVIILNTPDEALQATTPATRTISWIGPEGTHMHNLLKLILKPAA